jgi:hypothetical protein
MQADAAAKTIAPVVQRPAARGRFEPAAAVHVLHTHAVRARRIMRSIERIGTGFVDCEENPAAGRSAAPSLPS